MGNSFIIKGETLQIQHWNALDQLHMVQSHLIVWRVSLYRVHTHPSELQYLYHDKYEEKGKLKHATVSPLPGETKDITSLKIASHPNIYVLDTPGVLHPESLDIEMGSKLALTGAIRDGIVDETELARYALAILNLSNEHKRWEVLMFKDEEDFSKEYKAKLRDSSRSNMKRQKIFYSDHTKKRLAEALSAPAESILEASEKDTWAVGHQSETS